MKQWLIPFAIAACFLGLLSLTGPVRADTPICLDWKGEVIPCPEEGGNEGGDEEKQKRTQRPPIYLATQTPTPTLTATAASTLTPTSTATLTATPTHRSTPAVSLPLIAGATPSSASACAAWHINLFIGLGMVVAGILLDKFWRTRLSMVREIFSYFIRYVNGTAVNPANGSRTERWRIAEPPSSNLEFGNSLASKMRMPTIMVGIVLAISGTGGLLSLYPCGPWPLILGIAATTGIVFSVATMLGGQSLTSKSVVSTDEANVNMVNFVVNEITGPLQVSVHASEPQEISSPKPDGGGESDDAKKMDDPSIIIHAAEHHMSESYDDFTNLQENKKDESDSNDGTPDQGASANRRGVILNTHSDPSSEWTREDSDNPPTDENGEDDEKSDDEDDEK